MAVAFKVQVGESEPKTFSLEAGKTLKVGRASGNDIRIGHETNNKGISSFHAELHVETSDGLPKLCIMDLSMNGTRLKYPDEVIIRIEKGTDVPLISGVEVLLPTVNDHAQEGFTLTLEESPADSDDEEGHRTRFAHLLLSAQTLTKESTYEQAARLFSLSNTWSALDEDSRKDGFQTFVDTLQKIETAKTRIAEIKSKGKSEKTTRKNGKKQHQESADAKNGKKRRDDSVDAKNNKKQHDDGVDAKNGKRKRDDSVDAKKKSKKRK
eukprot:TRINITY_DN29042_c0_g1_i1.p1 TRINITY_DN29042_c0_g1~~TRINITY_DN29042_c0_g1_i1.p1  ORF type:complete len:279 (-),score=55.12 TRINITY_DN29042_c0_g1_i1:264-1064(-)